MGHLEEGCFASFAKHFSRSIRWIIWRESTPSRPRCITYTFITFPMNILRFIYYFGVIVGQIIVKIQFCRFQWIAKISTNNFDKIILLESNQWLGSCEMANCFRFFNTKLPAKQLKMFTIMQFHRNYPLWCLCVDLIDSGKLPQLLENHRKYAKFEEILELSEKKSWTKISETWQDWRTTFQSKEAHKQPDFRDISTSREQSTKYSKDALEKKRPTMSILFKIEPHPRESISLAIEDVWDS